MVTGLSGLFFLLGALPAGAVEHAALDPQTIERLRADGGGDTLHVSLNSATGAVRFLSVEPGRLALSGATAAGRAADLLARYGTAFGVKTPEAELAPPVSRTDAYGFTHLSYAQVYHGLPVFAGVLRIHFDAALRLSSVNGTVVPGIAVDPRPQLTAEDASRIAVAEVVGLTPTSSPALEGVHQRLLVYRAGLIQGLAGADHLAFEVEVGDRAGIREFVYVDAHSGQVVDRISGIQDALTRKVHQPELNNVVIWSEGNSLPYSTGNGTNDNQVNEIINRTKSVYDLYKNLSGGSFLAWNGTSGTMHSVWKASFLQCPNASWNGTSTNFCDGVAPDDVVAHEWTHAYTESTHGLIYAWQPGALNESYSDIFGEVVDLIDGVGTDSPGGARTVGDCSTAGGTPPPTLVVNAPSVIAHGYAVSGAEFNPSPPVNVTANVQLVNDNSSSGGGSTTDACQSLVGFTAGRIALIDRGGGCNFASKVQKAQSAGASAVIMVNTDDSTFTMGGGAPGITIFAVMISKSDGDLIKAQLGGGVNATISDLAATQSSVRWLVAEDSAAFGGPIRDMWNPDCFGNPAKVSDVFYQCSAGDGGGVHQNSGVPNHAFALLVDGGTFNGHTVAAVGLTRAAHLYWRAMSVYQVPDTDFADHGDALQQSCTDLLGVNLPDLSTGLPSGQVISAAHCAAVGQAVAAVEFHSPPPCTFTPLLSQGAPPPVCPAIVFFDGFEADPSATWTRANSGVFAEYDPRDWQWVQSLPGGRPGKGYFAIDSPSIGDCAPGSDDQSGMMSLTSPPIALSAGGLHLSFYHYVATEPQVDGGNLRLSVNGGPFTAVPGSMFTFNPYNDTLLSSDSGNTNPMAGQAAFTGADGGQVTGSWGQSQVDLGTLAGAGNAIRLRFDFGVDGCNGLHGWYLDDVSVCTNAWAAGRVPDHGPQPGPPLVLARAGANLSLDWTPSCLASDTDYEVYEGTLGSFTSHVPRLCSTGGASAATISMPAGNKYYLVTPRNAGREGSYGKKSSGVERPASTSPCLPQQIAAPCP
jgi:Zn-dependent metalloprotease